MVISKENRHCVSNTLFELSICKQIDNAASS